MSNWIDNLKLGFIVKVKNIDPKIKPIKIGLYERDRINYNPPFHNDNFIELNGCFTKNQLKEIVKYMENFN